MTMLCYVNEETTFILVRTVRYGRKQWTNIKQASLAFSLTEVYESVVEWN